MPTVATQKELNPTWVPLLLAAYTFQGTSTKLLVSTVPLDGVSNPAFPGIGILPAGNYVGRVAQQDIDAFQQRSRYGIDGPSKVTLHLYDADHFVWNNFVIASGETAMFGFRGATVQIALVMWQPGTSNFTSDAPVMFVGTCDMEVPVEGGDILKVSATNSHYTGTIRLPLFPVQNRCPLDMPVNLTQRTSAASDQTSRYYPCGYSADVIGGIGNKATVGGPANDGKNIVDSYGNHVTDGNGVYLMCDFTRSNNYLDAQSHLLVGGCMARLGNPSVTTLAPDGDIMHDTSGHRTGSFAGVQWSPKYYYAYGLNYTGQTNIPLFNFINSAVLGQYHTLLYGTQWVSCKIANVLESGNDTKCEAMICTGDIGQFGVQVVTVNGIALGRAPSGDPNLFWDFANQSGTYGTGGRQGVVVNGTTAYGYNDPNHLGLGDPYGSIARIIAVFYKDIFTGYGVPTVNVLASGPQVLVFSDQTTYTLQGSPANSNPVWVLLDILLKGNWTAPEIDMSTFISAASFCSASVTYINQMGVSTTHPRFKCQFALDTRKLASEIISGVLRCFNGYLTWGQNGLLQLFINQTLADSQSSPITGSNYNTGIASVHADGSAGTGYVAYSFDETNVRRVAKGNTESPDITAEENTTLNTPNQIFIQFQDEDNQYVVDSLGQIDSAAVSRSGGSLQPGGSLVPETLNVVGISNFDQAIRIANVYLAERQRGNEADDPRGTRIFTIGTTVKCEHLRVGHLVWLTWQAFNISQQLFRVVKKATSTNGEIWHITLQWHVDLWYTDVYGQAPQAFGNFNGTNRPSRSPLPLQAYSVPNNQSSLYSATEWNFGIAEIDTIQQDGSQLIQAQVYGQLPLNHIATGIRPPLVPTQATTSTSSGFIPAGTYYFQICAIDNNLSNTIYIISTATWSAGVVTLTVTPSPGDQVLPSPQIQVAGVSVSGYNGTFAVASSGPNTITYNLVSNPGGSGSGGTATVVGNYTAPSGVITATLSAQGNITLSPIYWDSNSYGYAVFMGTDHCNLTYQLANFPGLGGLPSSINLTRILNTLAFAPPDLVAGELELQGKWLVHGGIVGSTITAVTSTTVTINGSGFTNNVANHYLILFGRPNLQGAQIPLADFKITSNSGLVLTLDRNPTGVLQIGDVVGISAQADIHSATTIGDSNAPTSFFPTGFTQEDIGKLVRIIAGTGRYQVRTITAVSADGTTYTVGTPWNTIPDSTSTFIVEDTTWVYNQGPTTQIDQSSYGSPNSAIGTLNITNLAGVPVILQALIGDSPDAKFSPDQRSPFRMFWVFGAQGTRTVTANDTMRATDGTLQFNTSGVTGSTDTLAAAITTTVATTISVSGTAEVNGTYITIDSESMFIQSGGGTGTLTVLRGQLGTTAATHSNGATISLPGFLTFTLLAISSVPNVNLFCHKVSTDINYVKILPAGGDTLPNGVSAILLVDDTSALGTFYLKAPGPG